MLRIAFFLCMCVFWLLLLLLTSIAQTVMLYCCYNVFVVYLFIYNVRPWMSLSFGVSCIHEIVVSYLNLSLSLSLSLSLCLLLRDRVFKKRHFKVRLSQFRYTDDFSLTHGYFTLCCPLCLWPKHTFTLLLLICFNIVSLYLTTTFSCCGASKHCNLAYVTYNSNVTTVQ